MVRCEGRRNEGRGVLGLDGHLYDVVSRPVNSLSCSLIQVICDALAWRRFMQAHYGDAQ